MIDTTDTLNHLYALEEQATIKVGPTLDRATQILEGRRRVAMGAAWLVYARDRSDFPSKQTLNSVGFHLRQAQQILDRELAG